MTNKELCERYPFLIPFNRFSGMRMTDPRASQGGFWPGSPDEIPDPYNYEYTELDEMPDGWRNAFGEQMCEEIREALLKFGGEEALDRYRVEQIKEKFGYLRWYDCYGCKEVDDIISKYEEISENTCIRCGKPATMISLGWISPFCGDCAEELGKNEYIKFAPSDKNPLNAEI